MFRYRSNWGRTITYKNDRLYYDESYEITRSSNQGLTYLSLNGDVVASQKPQSQTLLLHINKGTDACKKIPDIQVGSDVILQYDKISLHCKLMEKPKPVSGSGMRYFKFQALKSEETIELAFKHPVSGGNKWNDDLTSGDYVDNGQLLGAAGLNGNFQETKDLMEWISAQEAAM